MTLPYPNSPETNENIAQSISRIEQNLEFLDSALTNEMKVILSTGVELSTKTGVENVTGVGFQPKALIAIATSKDNCTNSWGCAAQTSTTTSTECGCIAQTPGYLGVHSSSHCIAFYQTSASYTMASVNTFTSNGVTLNWTKTLTPGGEVAKIMYIFFG